MYNEQIHTATTVRIRNGMRALKNLAVEFGGIDDIYVHETVSGTDPAFVSNSIATKDEFVSSIVLMRRILDALALDGQTANITSEDQTANLTPFLIK